ncbi:hypothetical protein [Streptomyces sp. NPDC051576]|uniref:hypothetical protein n=1 Tax=Streptomyces sp. NPDC051576 TaxID=3155803 RepID=UPI003412C24E
MGRAATHLAQDRQQGVEASRGLLEAVFDEGGEVLAERCDDLALDRAGARRVSRRRRRAGRSPAAVRATAACSAVNAVAGRSRTSQATASRMSEVGSSPCQLPLSRAHQSRDPESTSARTPVTRPGANWAHQRLRPAAVPWERTTARARVSAR